MDTVPIAHPHKNMCLSTRTLTHPIHTSLFFLAFKPHTDEKERGQPVSENETEEEVSQVKVW